VDYEPDHEDTVPTTPEQDEPDWGDPDSYEPASTTPVELSPATQRLTEQMLGILAEFEKARRAEFIAAGGNPDDSDPFETVRAIADDWADTADDPDRRDALLDRLTSTLDTSDVRALRLAAEAAAAITPRLIQAYANAGHRPANIAADLDVTESYVYRVLREQRAAQADAQADADAEWSAFYTVERWDVDHWWEEAAQSTSTTDGPATLARRLLDRAQPDYPGAKLRVQVWKFGESEGFPLATAVTGQQ